LQAFAVTAHGDPGRIIAAILQTPQSLNDDRYDLLLADVSYNAAHIALLLVSAGARNQLLCQITTTDYGKRHAPRHERFL
jgi:hypothetical protein